MYPTGSVDRLLAKPNHIPSAKKFEQDHKRSLISYTGEDTEQTTLNLPLVRTLRDGTIKQAGSSQNKSQTILPPDWYEDDLKKYNSKFDLAIKERKEFKKRQLAGKNFSCLNKNDNAVFNMDDGHRKGGQVGQLLPTYSEFKRSLQRRKSRQSTRSQ